MFVKDPEVVENFHIEVRFGLGPGLVSQTFWRVAHLDVAVFSGYEVSERNLKCQAFEKLFITIWQAKL